MCKMKEKYAKEKEEKEEKEISATAEEVVKAEGETEITDVDKSAEEEKVKDTEESRKPSVDEEISPFDELVRAASLLNPKQFVS